MRAKSISSKDLGVECWSTVRLVKSDCTSCERFDKCRYLTKGIYPQPDSDQLYKTQLRLLRAKGKILATVTELLEA